MKLKEQLEYYLVIKGISASRLSKLSGVSKSTISDWLSGTNPRNISQVKKVADVFGVSLDELCFGKIENIKNYQDEINAGVFEVVLRRIKK